MKPIALLTPAVLLLLLLGSSPAAPPALPLPTLEQLAWQRCELTMFCHFGMNTFTDREWGLGKEDERLFNPSALDARQWARTAKQAGFKLMILTAKHHDGFCLWPSKFTEHCLKNSPWQEGRGDVVRQFVEACRGEGLKVGLYLSPWDRNNPAYGSDAYNDYFVAQLTELLTNYGPVDEMWFDGACGEGPNGRKQVYDWARYYATIRRLAPHALIAISGPDIRWVGNESGVARPNESSVRPDGKGPDGRPRLKWYPAECDVSIRPGWFYHAREDGQVKPLSKLLEIYFASVGRNSVLLLNVPPDRRGLFSAADCKRLREFAAAVRGLQQGRVKATATATGRALAGFSAAEAVDGNLDTYWSPGPDATTGTLELDFGAPQAFNVVDIQEAIAMGERVSKYRIDVQLGDGWRTLVRGTVIGQRNLYPIATTTARRVRLVIEEAKLPPCIAEFGVRLAPLAPPPQKPPLAAN
jgi:alpha-L-fucosidase